MLADDATRLPASESGNRMYSDGLIYRILLVDDNVDFITTMALLLRRLGHEVATAYDAPEAIVVAVEFQPEFAFLDIGLPTGNGYELAQKLTDIVSPGLKLVAISGWGQKEDRLHAEAAGFGWYLVKPVDPDSILHILAGASAQQQSAG
jgi:CheY-like chemotaxis protein